MMHSQNITLIQPYAEGYRGYHRQQGVVDGNIPADASFSQIGTAIDIDPDQTFTIFTDGSGGSEYWYKTTYFNSVTLAETNITQSFAARGGGYGHLVAVERVLPDFWQLGF